MNSQHDAERLAQPGNCQVLSASRDSLFCPNALHRSLLPAATEPHLCHKQAPDVLSTNMRKHENAMHLRPQEQAPCPPAAQHPRQLRAPPAPPRRDPPAPDQARAQWPAAPQLNARASPAAAPAAHSPGWPAARRLRPASAAPRPPRSAPWAAAHRLPVHTRSYLDVADVLHVFVHCPVCRKTGRKPYNARLASTAPPLAPLRVARHSCSARTVYRQTGLSSAPQPALQNKWTERHPPSFQAADTLSRT